MLNRRPSGRGAVTGHSAWHEEASWEGGWKAQMIPQGDNTLIRLTPLTCLAQIYCDVRMRIRPRSAVTIAPASSSAPCRAMTSEHALPCWRAEKPTIRRIP